MSGKEQKPVNWGEEANRFIDDAKELRHSDGRRDKLNAMAGMLADYGEHSSRRRSERPKRLGCSGYSLVEWSLSCLF